MAELKPAYGRKYSDKKQAIQDYLNGWDFIYARTGQYCSCRDFIGTEVFLQYGCNGLDYHLVPVTAINKTYPPTEK